MTLAKDNTDNTAGLPEVDGIYDVPGHPKLKLKVIVHKVKTDNSAKPSSSPKPSPTPSPVCTISDPDSSSQVKAGGWHMPSGMTYSLSTSSAPNSVRSSLANIAQISFTEWSKNTGGLVSFNKGADTTIVSSAFDGQNIIAWNRIGNSALAITYTWYFTDTGLVAENDTIMNKKYSWSWTPYKADVCVNSSSYDTQDILTHELGHWMGLGDEYADSYINNTMYGYGSTGEIMKDTLTSGDISGLQTIYH